MVPVPERKGEREGEGSVSPSVRLRQLGRAALAAAGDHDVGGGRDRNCDFCEGGERGVPEREELIKGFQSEKSKGTIERADVTVEERLQWHRGGGMREEMAPYTDLTGKQ